MVMPKVQTIPWRELLSTYSSHLLGMFEWIAGEGAMEQTRWDDALRSLRGDQYKYHVNIIDGLWTSDRESHSKIHKISMK